MFYTWRPYSRLGCGCDSDKNQKKLRQATFCKIPPMNLITIVSKCAALALLAPWLNISANELESALRAAFDEKPVGQIDFLKSPVGAFMAPLKIFKHTFTVEPIEHVQSEKGTRTLLGTLRHLNDRGATEDIIVYRIIRQKGASANISWQLNGGDWRPVSEPVSRALREYQDGKPLTTEKRHEIEQTLLKAVDGTWRRAVEVFVAHIAFRDC